MSHRTDFILTDNARVASIQMSANEASAWHYHTHVIERIVCLNGSIEVQVRNTETKYCLAPGEMATIEAQCDHRVVNASSEASTYLLIQNGAFDFVTVDR